MPFDQRQADMVCNFFELVLKHTLDEWYGKPFILCPWQEEALQQIFGRVDNDGNRTVDMAYLEVPKKSGKTELMAGVALYVLTTTSTPGCQVYGAAAATRQALNVYRAACKMVEQSPLLSKQLMLRRGTNTILKRADRDSFYAAIAADGDFGDGVNPAFVVADEVHRWKTRKHLENWDVLSKGGVTRKQTLTVAITTAGVQEESPLAWKLHEKTERISVGIVSDSSFYGKIYGAHKSDDPADPQTWLRANPSLLPKGFLDPEKIRKEYEKAESEGDLTSFKRYFLNIWDQRENRAIEISKWDRCAGPWKAIGLQECAPEDLVRPLHRDMLAHFIDRPCWVGVDLSQTTDTSAAVFVFPVEGEDEAYEVLPFFWLPEDRLRKLELKLGVPLSRWAQEGYLEVCPGEVIEHKVIRARIEWGARMFDLKEICWDPYDSNQISAQMGEAGFKCQKVAQSYAALSEPTKKILELVARGRLFHGGHPVLRWHAGVAATISDGKDNIMFAKPDRVKGTARIDGMQAIATALNRVLIDTGGGPSIYESRGLLDL